MIYGNKWLSFLEKNTFIATLVILFGGLSIAYAILQLASKFVKICKSFIERNKNSKRIDDILPCLNQAQKEILRKLLVEPSRYHTYSEGLRDLETEGLIEVVHYSINDNIYKIAKPFKKKIKQFLDK